MNARDRAVDGRRRRAATALERGVRSAALLHVVFAMCASRLASAQPEALLELESPGDTLTVRLGLDETGRPRGTVAKGDSVVATFRLGLDLAGSGRAVEGLRLVHAERAQRDESYSIPVGKTSRARDHHRALTVTFADRESGGHRFGVTLRAYDDGVAFRYSLPAGAEDSFVLRDELTEFTFPGEPVARYLPLPSYTTSYEARYETRALSGVSAGLIALPLLLERPEAGGQRVWIALTEAELTDYAGLYTERLEGTDATLVARLSPLPGRTDGAKVIGKTPHASPWRVLMIADEPSRLLESNLVFHLNEPSRIDDPSWIRPGRTTFPWWNAYTLGDVPFEPGLNTETHKHYIDFCAEEGIEYHSLDGTDTAWYGGPIVPKGVTDITTSVPEIDLPELFRYAKKKGVRLRLWMHWRALKPQIDAAFPLYVSWGAEGVMVDFMDRDDQEMVAFYHEVAEKAARHRLTVTWHGSYKPTGMERTWPNVLTYESALNQEYNKWDERGTPPEHNLSVAFIRMLAGPVDYHQGAMRNVPPGEFSPEYRAPSVPGTRAHQLALYVVYQNHLPMLVDYPSAYRGEAGFDFIARVPVTWDETRVLHAEIGRAIIVARRSGRTWFLGGLNAGERTTVRLSLAFLGPDEFAATVYEDDPPGGPRALRVRQVDVEPARELAVTMAPAGGFAGVVRPRGVEGADPGPAPSE